MASAARSICRHYGLSGLQGFDFVIDERSRATKLIEINPRATQISHFNLGPGRDLAAALFEALSDRSAAWRPPIQSADISLFSRRMASRPAKSLPDEHVPRRAARRPELGAILWLRSSRPIAFIALSALAQRR